MRAINRIWAIFDKELKQLARDRITFGMIVMVPLVQLMLFGYAINTDVRHIPVGIVDLEQNTMSRALVQSLMATQVVNAVADYPSALAAESAIVSGDIKAALIIPDDFYRRVLQWNNASANAQKVRQLNPIRPVAQWVVDGSDTMVASAIKGLGSMPLNDVLGLSPRQQRRALEVVLYFNPEQRTAVNIVPGLLAVILTMTMILFTATAIVREREHGNMEFLITTPIHPIELMIGKILPFIGVGLIQTGIILGLGYCVFDVPIAGGLVALLVITLLFIFASLALGLILSTIARSQMQAMQLTVFILLPSILLSGFMFPFEAMPALAQHLAQGLPATHFVRAVRAVVLRDAALIDLSRDILWLAAFSVVALFIASLRFRKRLD